MWHLKALVGEHTRHLANARGTQPEESELERAHIDANRRECAQCGAHMHRAGALAHTRLVSIHLHAQSRAAVCMRAHEQAYLIL
jgi:hypothetical protein